MKCASWKKYGRKFYKRISPLSTAVLKEEEEEEEEEEEIYARVKTFTTGSVLKKKEKY